MIVEACLTGRELLEGSTIAFLGVGKPVLILQGVSQVEPRGTDERLRSFVFVEQIQCLPALGLGLRGTILLALDHGEVHHRSGTLCGGNA